MFHRNGIDGVLDFREHVLELGGQPLVLLALQRRVRDLPWGASKVWLALEMHRLYCRRCGVSTERIDFPRGQASLHPPLCRGRGTGL